jgi:hypothetical protein
MRRAHLLMQGRIEMLSDRLSFDLAGLALRPSVPLPEIANWYGTKLAPRDCAAITVAAGPHHAKAEHLLPVVRVAAALLASLSVLPCVHAVARLPAHSDTRPNWFATAVCGWGNGGPFHALTLSALERGDQGLLASRGLEFLICHEFRLTGRRDLAPDDAARSAIRLTDWLITHCIPQTPRKVQLEGAGTLWIAATPDGLIEARHS